MELLQKIEQQLTNIENNQAATKEVLTFDEAALFTGLSKSYLYKLTSAGIIPHSKPLGKQLYFDRIKVQEWLLGKPIKTNSEINTQATNYVTLRKGKK